MNKLNGKRILIFQQRGWAKSIGHHLAKKLQENGCQLAALTLKKTTHEIISNQREVKYEQIINVDRILEGPEEILGNENISLDEICEELKIDSIWPFLQSNRLFIRSYEEKFFYSFRQSVSDEFIVAYIKAFYKTIRDLFEKFKPDAVFITGFIYDGHVILNLFANKYKIPIISILDTKIKGYYIFSHSYNNDSGPFFDHIDNLNNKKIETKNREKARIYIKEFREKFKKPDYAIKEHGSKSLIQTIKQELAPYKHIFNWYVKKEPSLNCLKSVRASIDCKPPRIILRDHYCHKFYKKFMEKYNYYHIEKIGKFVYFPLQFQPEASIDLSASYFNNQIETAKQVAMSLPGDYTLAVKEHPAMVGFRSPSYINKIARTPNVKLIDHRISSEKILEKADLIISPNSTSIAEAAFYYKPAIQLGNLGTTLKLPNVFKHTDMTTLSGKIKEVLKMDLKNDEYERRLENYVAAVYDVGFSVKYYDIWEKRDNSKTSLEKLIDSYVLGIIQAMK